MACSSGEQVQMEKRLIDNIPIFCISLKRTKERTDYARELFRKQNLNVRFFNGIDCQDLNLEDFNLYETVHEDRKEWKIRSGVIGGSFSHILLWNTIWRMGYEEALILEDDVEFVDDFKEKFEVTYKELPTDWNMFRLGAIYWPGTSGEIFKVSPHLVKYHPVCFHAYMVKRSILKTLIQTMSISFIDIDWAVLYDLKDLLKIYIADPVLVTEKSYNNGSRVKEGIWKSISNPDLL